MTDRELQNAVNTLISDSIKFVDTELTPERAEATDYYHGRPFGNEEDGRSQFVSTDVRDGVIGVLPSLLRVFFGPERVVEFAPRTAEDVDKAEQASDYVQKVFEGAGGFLKSYSVLKDGLVRKLGIFKWGWNDTSETKPYKLENVPQSQLEIIVSDPGVKLNRAVQKTEGKPALVGPDGQPMGEVSEATFDVELTYKDEDGTPDIWAIPPEEFIFSAESRSLEDGTIVGHRTEKTASELIAMGVSKKDIEEHGGVDSSLDDNEEQIARQPGEASGTDSETGDEANDKHLYVEGYVRIDYDGDGIAELRKICTLGPEHHIIVNEPWDEAPFSIFCPDPEPHTIVGQSWADRLKDIQRVKSMLTRSTLDSLAASIYPRTAMQEGQVSVADVQNTEIGAIIRTKAPPGAVLQTFQHTFAGKEAFPFFTYFDDAVERRTGQNKGAMGLDADALQSSTKSAVGAAVTAAQAQTEMLARIFAETTLKPLFRGLLKLFVQHQPKAKTVQLRGKWVEIDPRAWDADMDVLVNVALGGGLVETKVQTLMAIAEKQELIIETLGPSNPIVTVPMYANTLRRLVELSGFKDSSSFFNAVDPKWQPPAPAEPPADPAMEMVKIEGQKAQIQAAAKQRELELKAQDSQMKSEQHAVDKQAQMEIESAKLSAQAETERVKLESAAALRMQELEAEMAMKREEAQMRIEAEVTIAREKMAQEAAAAQAKIEVEMQKLALDRERMAADIEVRREQIAAQERASQMQAEATTIQARMQAEAAVVQSANRPNPDPAD